MRTLSENLPYEMNTISLIMYFRFYRIFSGQVITAQDKGKETNKDG